MEECSAEVRKIQDFHMGPGRNWWDIGYNFLIGEDGRIYEGRGFDAQGAHWYVYCIYTLSNSRSFIERSNPPQIINLVLIKSKIV